MNFQVPALRNALELGVSEEDHRAMLSRIAGEMGVRVDPGRPDDLAMAATGPPARERSYDPTAAPAPERTATAPASSPVGWVVLGVVSVGLVAVAAWWLA